MNYYTGRPWWPGGSWSQAPAPPSPFVQFGTGRPIPAVPMAPAQTWPATVQRKPGG